MPRPAPVTTATRPSRGCAPRSGTPRHRAAVHGLREGAAPRRLRVERERVHQLRQRLVDAAGEQELDELARREPRGERLDAGRGERALAYEAGRRLEHEALERIEAGRADVAVRDRLDLLRAHAGGGRDRDVLVPLVAGLAQRCDAQDRELAQAGVERLLAEDA